MSKAVNYTSCDEQEVGTLLKQFPALEIVSRDRGGCYAKAIRLGTPAAQQVLDRWHLIRNLCEQFQKILAKELPLLHQAGRAVAAQQPPDPAPVPSASVPRERRKPPRRAPMAIGPQRAWQLAMFERVHALAREGVRGSEIARQLQISPSTVHKYLKQEQLADRRHSPRPFLAEPYRAFLEQRLHAGPVQVRTLWHELQAQGFTGSYKSVWNLVRTLPSPPHHPPAVSPQPVRRPAVSPSTPPRHERKVVSIPNTPEAQRKRIKWMQSRGWGYVGFEAFGGFLGETNLLVLVKPLTNLLRFRRPQK
ncbi:hypothetical protein EI42_05649 [Thermosporothrix hazakensis]|uniref:HTH IS21-type domain-containing protein n=1 Tax=Thermosporothrix hazakensis TaxID=644383 RepID=A0A326TXI3_THEHA|nr:hypothetical protein [Thermosporothrix hazakensis]PZW21113.1 hypothetical protein EI42_05649 [Thermosporothrix hazakensis]GCE50722.1 hypothetical protein KTH_55910 [Thermosporothrix hazakensis]